MPRDAPIFYVRCLPDGPRGQAPRVEDVSARVLTFKYEDEERKADKLTLTLDNWDLTLFDDPAFRRGMHLEASWGYPGNMAPARLCVIKSVKGATVITVVALGRAILLHERVRARSFTGVRRSDVVRRIAEEAGYGAEAQDVEETPVVYETITQARLTDAQLLARLARLEGFEFYVDNDGLHWHRRRVEQAPARVLTYFTSQTGDIVEFDVENDLTARPGRTRVRGRDPLERADIDVVADDASDSGRTTLAPIRIIVDPETRETRVEQVAGSEEVRPTSAQDATTATREARGRFRRIQQTAVKLKLTLIGDPSLLAKTVVDVRGLGPRVSGRYYVKRVEHSIGGDGYRLAVQAVSDGDGGHSRRSGVAHGLDLLSPGPHTRARTNDAPAPPGAESATPSEGAALEPVTRVDPETRRTVTTYRDARGRARREGA